MDLQRDLMVFTPIYRLEPETVLALFALEWEGAITYLLQRDNPTGNPHLDHLHQYQRGREAFLNGRYSAMLVIESDIIPPAEGLEKMWRVMEGHGDGETRRHGADIVYGCYMFRDGGVVNILERYKQPARNTGESLTTRGLYKAAVKKGVIECSGSGLGCALISRKVIEQAPFEGDGSHFFDCDWTETVYRQGWRMLAEMSVACGHKRDGVTAWPA